MWSLEILFLFDTLLLNMYNSKENKPVCQISFSQRNPLMCKIVTDNQLCHLFILTKKCFFAYFKYLFLAASCLSYSTWALLLELTDSCCRLQAYGLGCSVAGRISVSQPGIKPTPAALQGRFFATGPPRKSQDVPPLSQKQQMMMKPQEGP